MAAQREAQPSANVLNTIGPGNMPEEPILSKRSPLPRRLGALVAATAVILAVGALGSSPLEAKPPPKTTPLNPNSIANWWRNYWKSFVPKSPPKQKMPAAKALPKMKALKPAPTNPKSLPKQANPAPQPNAKIKQVANAPNPALKPLPQLNQAHLELTEAWRHVKAAHLPAKAKTAALNSVGQALLALGGAMPKPSAAGKKDDHITEAGVHLLKAHKEVVSAKHLPTALRKAVLREIKNAQTVLETHANAAAGKAAPPRR